MTKIERYYAVFENLTLKPYADLDTAKKVEPLFILDFIETRVNTTDSQFEFKVFGKVVDKFKDAVYIFYHADAPIIHDEWRLINVRAQRKKVHNEDIGFDVADPSGELRELYFGAAISDGGVLKAVEFLKKVSKFKSWEEYDKSLQHKSGNS